MSRGKLARQVLAMACMVVAELFDWIARKVW